MVGGERTGVGTTGLSAAGGSRAGGDEVTGLTAVRAEVVVRPAAAFLIVEGPTNTSRTIQIHGASTGGWVLEWEGGVAAGVGVLRPLRLLLLLLLLLRGPGLVICQPLLRADGCHDVSLQSGR